MRAMTKRNLGLALLGLFLAAILLYQIPAVQSRLAWRLDLLGAAARNLLDPAGAVPTARVLAQPEVIVVTPEPTEAPADLPTPTTAPTPTALPASASIDAPEVEYQTPNNCGPATLSLYLRLYGWDGDQTAISDEIKPVDRDRNVNVDELDFYVRTQAGWLNTLFRVGGDIEMLKAFVSAGIPVMVEKGEIIEVDYLFNDDYWAGHYALVTGYEDASGTFTYQDTFRGADQQLSYADFDIFWQQFNRVFTLVYLPGQEATVQAILGPHWDEEYNREQALQTAIAETQSDPENVFVWFNLGMNQVYFEQYPQAAQTFDKARDLGWPMRMLRYQFGPFFAYFHSNRNEDLHALADYALRTTDVSEEAMIWKGWALWKDGDISGAREMFNLALETNPASHQVQQAIDYLNTNP
jgi:tetratricopeptide (TPR) repeat protein